MVSGKFSNRKCVLKGNKNSYVDQKYKKNVP